MRFEKWQALGNDYLIVDRAQLPFKLTPDRVRAICESHFGVGADGVLLVAREGREGMDECNDAPAGSLRVFNPDGSEAELSGNGAREAALYMHRHGWSVHPTFAIATPAGEVLPTVTAPDTCTINLGHATTSSKDFPSGPPDGVGELDAAGRSWRFQHVSIGNPQCAIYVDNASALEALDLSVLGPPIEANGLFPNRTNVSWYAQLGEERIRARIFERGVGETLSSGTGAAGAAVAHVLRTRGGARTVAVALDGGVLEVHVGEDLAVEQTGWAKPVFEGRLSEELVAALAGAPGNGEEAGTGASAPDA
jgi:diaminopimelate epimerase